MPPSWDPITLLINGVDRTALVKFRSFKVTWQSGGRSTLSFNLIDETASYVPLQHQDVEVKYDGVSRYTGKISSVDSRYESGVLYTDVRCQDSGIRLERRIVYDYLPIGLYGTIDSAINEIVDRWCSDLVTWNGYFGGGPALGDQLFNYVPAMECLRQIASKGNADLFVTADGELVAYDKDAGWGTFTPSIIDTDPLVKYVKAIRNSTKKANVVYAKNSSNAKAIIVESFVGDDYSVFWLTKYPQNVKPIITENGNSMRVIEYNQIPTSDGEFDYYYFAGALGIYQKPGNPPLSYPDIVAVTYPSPVSQVAIARDEVDVAINGELGYVAEVKDINDPDALQAYADGLLERLANDPVEMEAQISYGFPYPGQVVHVTSAVQDIDDDFVINSVNSAVEFVEYGSTSRTAFVHTIRGVLKGTSAQKAAQFTEYFKQIVERSRNFQDASAAEEVFTLSKTSDDSSGSSTGTRFFAQFIDPFDPLVAGVDLIKPQYVVSIPSGKTVTIEAAAGYVYIAPTGQSIRFDIEVSKDGGATYSTIFGATKLEIAVGQKAGYKTTGFNITVLNHEDRLRYDVDRVGSATKGSYARVYIIGSIS